jgi:G6PDH family F420-dependent oxidoreductase
MEYGYTLMSEEHGPRALVDIARRAEEEDFSFLVQSDHYHPWVPEQQHSPYAWSVLGAVAVATESIELATYVTCPIIRYHPAVVAQKAATMALLSNERFTLSVGAGENLNEHVVGEGWPPVHVRHEMLAEAIEIMRLLWQGGYQRYQGEHFRVDDARIFDLPDRPVPIAVAVSGRASLDLALRLGDELVAVEPLGDLVRTFRAEKGSARVTGQIPVCFGTDAAAAREKAHERFRWAQLGWKVMAELPNPVNFAAATGPVSPEQVGDEIPHGPDVGPYVDAVKRYADAGFDRLAFVQIGDDQEQFFEFWRHELRDALREAVTPVAA